MRSKSVLSAVAFILLFMTAGFAQDFKSEVSVQGTANLPKNSTNIDIPHDATKSGGFLIGYRYHLSSWFALQGDYGYTRDTQKYFDPIFGETDIQANIHQLTGEAVITAPSSSRVRPYGLAGIGGLFFRPTNSLSNNFIGVGNGSGNNQTKPAFVYGGGVDFDINKYLALRAEYRGYFYKIPDFQLTGLASDNFTHLAQPSVGLVWRF
ncbi:MAG TPA: porin family protein [Candidatus Angelobacter sp.]|nr:porin family protein [Candidatus Angelobacter sp.]